jgi:hypothetical protein
MIRFFTIEEPFYIFLIVPLIISTFTTSKTWLRILNLVILKIFFVFLIAGDISLLDSWLFLSLMIGISVYFIWTRIRTKYFSGSQISLNDTEQYIYDRDFRSLMKEEEFRMFFNLGRKESFKNKGYLAEEGMKFEKVFYLASIPAYKSILLKSKNTLISYLRAGSWIGIIELIFHMNNTKDDKWLVSIEVENPDVEIVYYEWDVEVNNIIF